MGRFNRFEYNPESKAKTVGAGLTLGEIYDEPEVH
jgi:hypothetical protein